MFGIGSGSAKKTKTPSPKQIKPTPTPPLTPPYPPTPPQDRPLFCMDRLYGVLHGHTHHVRPRQPSLLHGLWVRSTLCTFNFPKLSKLSNLANLDHQIINFYQISTLTNSDRSQLDPVSNLNNLLCNPTPRYTWCNDSFDWLQIATAIATCGKWPIPYRPMSFLPPTHPPAHAPT